MIDFPSSSPTPNQLADWVEMNLLLGGEDRLSQADIYDVLDDDPNADEPPELFRDFDWRKATKTEEAVLREEVYRSDAEGQSTNERLVESAWQELETRAGVVGDRYPFTVTRLSVLSKGGLEDATAYAFLLMLGARLSYGIGTDLVPIQTPSILFEQTVRVALGNYVGGRVRRFGWPYREVGLPSKFREAAKTLALELKENEWQFLTVSDDEKDHGLDVIAWNPFRDERFGQLVVLCQCAIGSDWDKKPVHVKLWNDVINLAAQPITAVAFVDLISNHTTERIFGCSKVSGILIDRIRLASLVSDSDLPEDLIGSIRKWVGFALGHLPRFE